MDEEAEEEDDQEDEKAQQKIEDGGHTKSRAQGNDRDKKIRGLLDDEDDESIDELSGDNSDGEQDSKAEKTHKKIADYKKSSQLAEANAAT